MMMRPPFAGHRRYSITHRAVQRLRELVSTLESDDDENVRDRLDTALSEAEDGGKAIRTLDAMLGEPQTLIPIEAFGDMLYAIVKEDTVVTVLPQGHGEEILQRGQLMEQRVASGAVRPRQAERDEPERWESYRRRWRSDSSPVVVERIVRGASPGGAIVARVEGGEAAGAQGLDTPLDDDELPNGATETEPDPAIRRRLAGRASEILAMAEGPRTEEVPRPEGPLAEALAGALELGRRRAAIAALSETLSLQHRDASLLPLWNALVGVGVPQCLTVGDLIEAVRNASH